MMKKIEVVNIYKIMVSEYQKTFEVVNIMRPSVLGNPFFMKSESERTDCIEKFRQYLWKEICKKSKVYDELKRLADSDKSIALVCCCKPKACHGDVIKAAIEWMRKENIR